MNTHGCRAGDAVTDCGQLLVRPALTVPQCHKALTLCPGWKSSVKNYYFFCMRSAWWRPLSVLGWRINKASSIWKPRRCGSHQGDWWWKRKCWNITTQYESNNASRFAKSTRADLVIQMKVDNSKWMIGWLNSYQMIKWWCGLVVSWLAVVQLQCRQSPCAPLNTWGMHVYDKRQSESGDGVGPCGARRGSTLQRASSLSQSWKRSFKSGNTH